jgi:hypothetical protein
MSLMCQRVFKYVDMCHNRKREDEQMELLGLDLPPADTVRWSPHRKASVVIGVRSGAISLDEACQRYQLSADEFLAWQRAVEGHGVGALRVTRLQYYRDPSASDGRALRARRGLLKWGNDASRIPASPM